MKKAFTKKEHDFRKAIPKREMIGKTPVIIMAGGKGTRISNLFPDIPKPLIPIDGIAVLEREIKSLSEQGFTNIIITVSYMSDKIINHFGNGSEYGVRIEYYEEKIPLGNAGALFKIRDHLGDSPFLLLNADAVFEVDFNRMLAYHKAHNAAVTLFTHPNNHPYDSGLLLADESCVVQKWLTKEDIRPEFYKNRVNAGLHIINPSVLDEIGLECNNIGTLDVSGKIIKVDLDRQVLKPLCGTGRMYCYDSPEYVKDMGTPERFKQVEKDYKAGIVKAKNLRNKQKAFFIDRDGTVNKYVPFLRNIDDFELLNGVAEAIKEINNSEYLAILVTNQPVIARGDVSFEDLNRIHNKMETLLGLEGAYLDGIYYCPHHPDKGFEGEIAELKFDCDCRKPKPGMLIRAAKEYNIDLSASWMIGDGVNDILAGKAAGCRTALVSLKENVGQDLTFNNLKDAVYAILQRQ